MPVSQAELRLLITAQNRAQQVVEAAASTINRVTQAVNQLGQSRGFQAAAQGAQQLGSAVQQLNRGNPFNAMTQGAQQFARVAQQAAQAARQMGTVSFGGGGGNQVGGLTSALSNVQAAFRNAQQAAQQASGAMSQSLMAIGNAARGAAGGIAGGLNAAFNGLRTSITSLGGVAGSIGSIASAASGLGAASGNVNTFSASLRNMVALGATIVGLNSAITALQSVWQGFTDAAIGFNSVLENTQNAFTSLFRGDTQKAAAFIQQLRQVAESTAFEFPDLLKMSQQLIGVGLAAEQVIPLMKDVAGAMTAAGRTTADINRVSRALQQIFTTGRVQADEMNQLAEAGVPGWRILGQAIQQSGESIESAIGRARELGKQGKISANDFFNAFQQFSRQEGWREMAENAVNTFTGAISNLKDSFRFLISDATQPAFLAMSQGIQNFSKLLMTTPVRQFALDVGTTVGEVIRSFEGMRDTFSRIFQGFSTSGVSGALQAIVQEFANLAGGMQSAGAQLMAAYADGIIQGASDLIQGAVDFVAELIASYLIGQSPPPAGPLANIEQGGRNVALAWIAGLSEGFQGVEQVAVGVADAFGRVNEQLTLGDARAAFAGAEGNLEALRAVAEDAEGALRSLNESQRELDREQGNLTTSIEAIKSGYGDQIDSLERSIEAIKEQNTEAERYAQLVQKQNDAISRQADLRDRAALNELKAAEIAAEGDPVRRAALIAEQATLKAQEKDLQLAQRAHDIAQRQEALDKRRADGKKASSTTDQQDIALAQQRLNLDRQQLENERKLAGLVDRSALAAIEARRAEIERAQAIRRVQEDRARMTTEAVINSAEIERAEKEIAALPLEQQLAAVKREQEAQLAPLQRQLEHLQQQERVLQSIRKEWQAIKADADDAARAQKALETATKAGAGKPGFAGGPLNLDRQEIDVGALANRVGTSFAGKFGEAFGANVGPIVFGVLGAVLGANLFGPLGLAAGAAFGAQVGASVQEQVPNLSTIFADAGRTFVQAFGGEWSTDHGDTWVSPLVDAAGRLGIAFRVTADVVAAAWTALRGPVGAAMQFIRENTGLVAAALSGLLVPAFAALGGVVGQIVGPVVGLLGRLSPAMIAVSTAAVALKLAWDANFGGLRDTATQALPLIEAAIGQLGIAFGQLTEGNFSGALDSILAAFQNLSAGVVPILTGLATAIQEQVAVWMAQLVAAAPQIIASLATWTVAFVNWAASVAAPILAGLGTMIAGILLFIAQNAGPILDQLATWAVAFVEWAAPIVGNILLALGAVILAVGAWIIDNGPEILAKLAAWAQAFVDWIAPFIPPMLAALGQAATDLFSWIAAQIPPLIAQLELWAAEFGAWVVPATTDMLTEIVQLGAALLDWILEQLPGLTYQLTKWATAFIAWIAKDVLPKLPAELLKIQAEIITQITNILPKMVEAGVSVAGAIIKGIADGLRSAFPDLAGAVDAVFEQLFNKLPAKIKELFGRSPGGNWLGAPGSPGNPIDTSGTLQQQAVRAALRHGLPPELFLAQIQQESGFNPEARSAAGARGIAQFMPATGNAVAGRMGVDPAKFWADVSLQIEGAAFHMRELLNQFQDYDRALAAYNAGAGTVERFGGIPPFAETQEYVRSIRSIAGSIQVPAMGTGVQGDPGRGLAEIRQKQGEWASMLSDASTICGPYLAALFADAVGRPPSPEEARSLAESMGVYGRGQGILAAGRFGEFATALVQQSNPGTTARVQQMGVSGPWQAGQMAQQALEAGAPLVGFNTPRHYFGATAFDPATRRFNTGGTGRVFGNEDPWLTAQQIAEMGGGLTHIITLTGQMGEGFTAAGQQATAALEATIPTVEQTGVVTERTAQVATNDANMLVTASTDALGNVTRLYSDASGVIGASITNASGQVVNAWGVIAQAQQNGAASAQAAQRTAQEFATTLTAQMVPAGAQVGTAVQQMTTMIAPLLAQIASGTLTTDQLVLSLSEMAASAGLTQEPLLNLQAGSTQLNTAMLQLFTAAAAVDPQFATLATTMQTTNADAQTMAVTFAEGVANSVGVASAAVTSMQAAVTPLIEAVDAGTVSGADLESTIVQMADAAGLATAPFREMRDGVVDSNQALEDVIALTADVSPEFRALAEEVTNTGDVSQEAARRYLELIRAFRQGARPNDEAAEGAQAIAQQAEQAAEPIAQLSTTMIETATTGAEAFQSTLVTGVSGAIESVRGLSGEAEAAGTEVGSALVRGMEAGIQSAAERVADRAREVVRNAIEAARSEGSIESPSKETLEMGYHLDAGLELGQIEDSKYVEQAARGVIAASLDAMREEADAHSPSGEGVRIGRDIMDGLIKGLQSRSLSDVAKQQIRDYIDVAGDFDDVFAKGFDAQVARTQHHLAGAQRDILQYTLAVKDAEEAIARAQEGTAAQRRQTVQLTIQQAEVQLRMAESAQADLDVENRLRDVTAEQERLLAGSLESRRQQATINGQILQIAVSQAENDLRSAEAAAASLPVRQQLAEAQRLQEEASRGTLESQLRQSEIAQRNAQIAVQTAQAERDLLPLRHEARDVQRQIEAATKGTLESQQAAIRASAQQAASRIEQLRIQQQLADAEETGGGLTQEQINALHERDRALQKQGETNARQAEIEKLQAEIATAADRERLLAIQDQISQRETALLPVQDEKALLDAENQVIAANNALAAAGYGNQIVLLQSQVAEHDNIALRLENERAALDAQTAVLQAQQGVIQATNEARAAALDQEILTLQAQMEVVNARRQSEQDILDRLANQQAVIDAQRELEAARLGENLLNQQLILEANQGQVRALERQLEIQQATAAVLSTQVQLANALKAALEAAGVIGDKDSGKKKKKKKRASGGSIFEDDVVLVGEFGPETIVAPDDGYVLNNATTERLMSALDIVSPRIDSTVRQRQVGGTVWGGRSYLVGEGSGVEGFARTWSPSGGDPGYMTQPTKIVNATVHYHVHEQQRSGEARVERVVMEAVQYAAQTG